MYGVYAVCELHVKHGWNAHYKVLRDRKLEIRNCLFHVRLAPRFGVCELYVPQGQLQRPSMLILIMHDTTPSFTCTLSGMRFR